MRSVHVDVGLRVFSKSYPAFEAAVNFNSNSSPPVLNEPLNPQLDPNPYSIEAIRPIRLATFIGFRVYRVYRETADSKQSKN